MQDAGWGPPGDRRRHPASGAHVRLPSHFTLVAMPCFDLEHCIKVTMYEG